MNVSLQPISYVIFAVVLTVTIVSSAVVLYAALTGRTGDPGVERDD
jgi:hypothetical protein